MDTFEEGLDAELARLRETLIRKQRDYGHLNILGFGEFGILVRVSDKVARLKNLIGNGKQPNNESVDDSWEDLAAYSVIALMLRHKTFELKLKADQ